MSGKADNFVLPPWLKVRRGRSSVIVVAPHGGTRQREIRRTDGMNDLRTAELGNELAVRLDAHALINDACDRNEIDLNRIRQLVAQAPVFLTLLRSRVAEIRDRGEVPLVLFIHGWNMAVPWCDVGVGIRERRGELFGRYPTVARDTYDGFVQPLVERLFECGLGASIGLRYPAAGRDNATQLFSGRHHEHDHDEVAALSRWAAADCVDAVQLELGIPLRWPGWRRQAFLDAVVDSTEAFATSRRASVSPGDGITARRRGAAWQLAHKPPASQLSRTAGNSVQAVLPDGTGIFMGAEPTGAATMAARICVALADGSMLLFVGEGPWQGRPGRYQVAGFQWLSDDPDQQGLPRRIRVRLSGPVVHYPTHAAFVDLEKGLAGSRIAECDLALEFVRSAQGYGTLRGSIRADNFDCDVDEKAVCEAGGRRAAAPRARTRLHVTSGEGAPRTFEDAVSRTSAASCRIEIAPAGEGAAAVVTVHIEGDRVVEGEAPVAVPVYRMLSDGRVVCVTFGTVVLRDGRRGVYERVELADGVADDARDG